MSCHRHHRRGCGGHHGPGGVFSKLGNAFDLPTGVVIAIFVVGWVFTPLLTTLIFVAAWYWAKHPDETRRQVDRVSDHARRAARRVSDAAFGGRSRYRRTATEPDLDLDDVDVDEPAPRRPSSAEELRHRFEELDRRAKRIEEVVASEEYRLEREFRRIDD